MNHFPNIRKVIHIFLCFYWKISKIYGKLPSLSLRKKNNRQKTRNTKVKSLLFFIFVLL